MDFKRRSAFTLIELLIVIGVIAILATITLLVLNPAEMLKQGRDTKRISEIASINDALNLAVAQNPNVSLGTPKVLYISLPDTSATCATWLTYLPPLGTGWQYQCVTTDNLRKNNGNGWLPVDFSSLPTSPFSNLPVDPVNAAQQGLFYSYAVTGGRWEVNADMESSKYKWGGERDVESADTGNTIVLYEKGTDLNVMPAEANWRIGYVARTEENCRDAAVFNYTDSWFPRWTAGGTGQAAVVKLLYWDYNGSVGPGEPIEVAMYNSGSPNYNKISEIVSIDGLGQAGWISSTLALPIQIDLSKNYIIGFNSPDSVLGYSVPIDNASNCSSPSGSPGTYYASQQLSGSVPITQPQADKYGFMGIVYSF